MSLNDFVSGLDRLSLAKVPGDEPGQYAWLCILVLSNKQVLQAEAPTPDEAVESALAQAQDFIDTEYLH